MVLYLLNLHKDNKTAIGNKGCWKKMTVMVTKQMMTGACSACLTPTPPHCIRSNKAGGVAGGGCELRGNAEVTQKFLRNSCKNSSATYAEPGEIDQLNWNERERPLRKNVGTFCIVWRRPQMAQSKTAPRLWKCICIGHTTHNCVLWSLFEDWKMYAGSFFLPWHHPTNISLPDVVLHESKMQVGQKNGIIVATAVLQERCWRCTPCVLKYPHTIIKIFSSAPKSPCLAPQNTTIFVRVLCKVYWRRFVANNSAHRLNTIRLIKKTIFWWM